jgi:hypothetical protein
VNPAGWLSSEWITYAGWSRNYFLTGTLINNRLRVYGFVSFHQAVPLVSPFFSPYTNWSIACVVAICSVHLTPNHLLLDSAPNIGQFISHWELDKLKNCWNKSFRTSKILTLSYQQFSNLLISQRDMSGPRLGALSNTVIGRYLVCPCVVAGDST